MRRTPMYCLWLVLCLSGTVAVGQDGDVGGKQVGGWHGVSLAQLEVPTYEPTKLPPELAAIEAVKPGSRGLKS